MPINIAAIAGAGGLFSRREALAAGIRSRRLTELVRTGVIARVARGVYAAPTRVAPTPDAAAIAASWRVVLSHWSAAAWWGIDLTRPAARVHVTAPRSRGRWRDAVAGVRLHRSTLRRGDVSTLRGTRVTTPLRTAIDIARHESLEDAVAVVDSFCRKGLMRQQDFVAAAAAAKGPGRVRIQLVALLCDEQSGSVLESLTRVLLWRAQLRPPYSQYGFRDPSSGWSGRLDFAWPHVRAALECDGYEYHASRVPFQNDRRRWSALIRAGWRAAVVTWFDVTGDPEYVVSLVRDLLVAAA